MAKKTKETKDIRSVKECPDCASQNLIYNEERQQAICRDCGLIYEPLAPELEQRFETSHEFIPRKVETHEKIMIRIAGEEPKKVRSRKVKKRRVRKKVKKPVKKKVKKRVKKVKKKVKPAKKKKAVKKKVVKKPVKKKGFLRRIKARLKKK